MGAKILFLVQKIELAPMRNDKSHQICVRSGGVNMKIEKQTENLTWLTANNKEQEYKAWCEKNSLTSSNPWSLKFFINEIKAEEVKKMRSSFSNFNGFFVEWKDNSGKPCRVCVRSERAARELFVTLKSRIFCELFQLVNGKLKKIA